ncbi:MAG: hypothetical protein U9O91_03285 [Candidatus Caldatribacteriota bacterium]|nr:hypothetical protein [Candidatus Caldatribacteriota bacterium]
MKLKKDYLFLVFLTILLIFVFLMTVGANEQLASEVYLVLEEWEFTGEMTIDMARVINENIDQIMEKELGQIKELIEKDKPDSAFVKMLRLTSFLNAGAAKLPSIIGRLEKWINEIKSVLNSLAKKIGADGFSISAGLPIGVSIGLSFSID